MDILKRNLSPITDKAWQEIDETAAEILKNYLSARKFVDVGGPKGWDFSAVTVGRIKTEKGEKNNVNYGIKEVKPLIESRIEFDLDIWELDNIERGAKDIDLEPLEEAAKKIALFEENAIYKGFKKANINGLLNNVEEKVKMSKNPEKVMDGISKAVSILRDESVDGPYNLVVNPDLWQQIVKFTKGYPVKRQIDNLIEGKIIYSPAIENALLVSTRGGDFELTLGHDFSIGYQKQTNKKVTLFITESFTYRTIDPMAAIKLEIE